MTNNPEDVEVPVTQADYALVHQVCVNHGNHDYQAQLAARHRLGHSPAGGEGEDYDALHLKVAQALFRQSGSFEIGLKVSEADELATAAIAALHTQTPDTVRERAVSEARSEAADELARLKAALRNIAEGDEPRPIASRWRADGKGSKHDQCAHGKSMWEDCGNCTSDFARTALGETA